MMQSLEMLSHRNVSVVEIADGNLSAVEIANGLRLMIFMYHTFSTVVERNVCIWHLYF